jgi:hypothetical protein
MPNFSLSSERYETAKFCTRLQPSMPDKYRGKGVETRKREPVKDGVSIKSTIENHPVVIFLAAIALGFGAYPSFTALLNRANVTGDSYKPNEKHIDNLLSLSSRLTPDKVYSATQLENSLKGASWLLNCGREPVPFRFGNDGNIEDNSIMSGYTWTVMSSKTVEITGVWGDRVYYMFADDNKSFVVIYFQGESCTGIPKPR